MDSRAATARVHAEPRPWTGGLQVGAQPKTEALHTWLQRMREQGWDVSDLVQRALACGAHLKAEVAPCQPMTLAHLPSGCTSGFSSALAEQLPSTEGLA